MPLPFAQPLILKWPLKAANEEHQVYAEQRELLDRLFDNIELTDQHESTLYADSDNTAADCDVQREFCKNLKAREERPSAIARIAWSADKSLCEITTYFQELSALGSDVEPLCNRYPSKTTNVYQSDGIITSKVKQVNLDKSAIIFANALIKNDNEDHARAILFGVASRDLVGGSPFSQLAEAYRQDNKILPGRRFSESTACQARTIEINCREDGSAEEIYKYIESYAIQYLSDMIRSPGHAVINTAFSPDGSAVLTVSEDGTARLWNAAIAKELVVLNGHEGRVLSAAFSPDGSKVLTASDEGTARLWDAATAKELVVLNGHEGRVLSAAFSLDGSKVLTASDDGTARLWDAATAKELVVLNGHEGWVLSAAFSPDGSTVLTVSEEGTAQLWDAAAAEKLAVLNGHEGRVLSAAFSPDGSKVFTASDDGTARLWDAATAKELAVLNGHEGRVLSAAFSPDGSKVFAASDDGTARLWDAATAKELVVLNGHEGRVLSAAFSLDASRVLTASDDGTARLWDVATAEELVVLAGLPPFKKVRNDLTL